MTFRIAVCWLLIALSTALPAQTRLSPAVRNYVSVDAPEVALAHVTVIDGTGRAPAKDQTVILSGGRVQWVGPSAGAPIPAGARVLDLPGRTVIPGLVGMHDHMFYPTGGGTAVYSELAYSAPRLYLAGGVTTIRTTGSIEPYTDLNLRQKIDAGEVPGPEMFVTGPYLEGAGSFTLQMHELKSAEEARRTVAFWADQGATSFKAYMNITRDELKAAIAEAHARGLKVTGHLCSIGFREAAQLGIDNLEHGLIVDAEFVAGKKPDSCPNRREVTGAVMRLGINDPEVQQTIRELVANRVAVTSTLPVFETFVPNRPPMGSAAPGRQEERYMRRVLQTMVPAARMDYLSTRARVAEGESPWGALFEKEMQFERAFVKAGGLLLAGLDPTGYGGVVPGFGDQRGVELLVEAGFTPVEALQIASFNGAQFLGIAERVGSIAAGKQADLVVVRGDPGQNIADIENTEIVFKRGVGYDPGKLIESAIGRVGLH